MTRNFPPYISAVLVFFVVLHCAASHAGTPHSIGLSLRRDALLLSGGALLYAAGELATNDVPAPSGNAGPGDVWFAERWVVESYSHRYGPWSDRTRSLAAILPIATTIPAILGSDTLIETAAVHAAITAETMLIAGGLTNLAKGIVQRKRPYYFNPDEPEGRRHNPAAAQSFWSGHAVVAFASAVNAAIMFQEYHPDSRWVKPVWIGGLTLATTTGVLRVAAGQHFPTDIVAAAAAGSFAGWIVPRLHRYQDNDNRTWRAVFTGNGVAILF